MNRVLCHRRVTVSKAFGRSNKEFFPKREAFQGKGLVWFGKQTRNTIPRSDCLAEAAVKKAEGEGDAEILGERERKRDRAWTTTFFLLVHGFHSRLRQSGAQRKTRRYWRRETLARTLCNSFSFNLVYIDLTNVLISLPMKVVESDLRYYPARKQRRDGKQTCCVLEKKKKQWRICRRVATAAINRRDRLSSGCIGKT